MSVIESHDVGSVLDVLAFGRAGRVLYVIRDQPSRGRAVTPTHAAPGPMKAHLDHMLVCTAYFEGPSAFADGGARGTSVRRVGRRTLCRRSLQLAVQIEGGTDQCQVREGLREVTELFAGWPDLL
jgi:hypothetical protein